MSELLSPAGSLEAFYAAISNGADAIYLGLDKFNARAYANNFTLENLASMVEFAHLRNVKIYVTMNTIVYDYEVKEVFDTIDKLAEIGVDALIVQDLSIINYVNNHYKSLHAHASTQMGIDDLDGAKLAKEIGINRIVFARETNIETLKRIRQELDIEQEAFIHGALCVSYSGNCFMSSMIGERSGNRGRCAGCCRKPYTLIDLNTNQLIKDGYLLSMKDLNVSSNINNLRFIDSFKIEGRMKEPTYVAAVTNIYRKLIDKENVNKDDLNKVFNRTYTKGFILGESSSDISNIEKPNNFGYEIGEVVKQNRNNVWIKLFKPLHKGDQIRIQTDSIYQEISIAVTKLFDANFNVVESSKKIAIIKYDGKVSYKAKVYKTKDIEFNNEINKTLLNKEYRKTPINMEFIGNVNKPMFLKVSLNAHKVFVKSDFIIENAKSVPTTSENVFTQLSKINDTPYSLNKCNIILDDNVFIPLKSINELRREAIEKLNIQRLQKPLLTNTVTPITPKKHDLITPEITVEVINQEQYDFVKSLGIKHIYYQNIIRRNNAKYNDFEGEVLVGGLGGINHYRNKNIVISDYSLNVTNHITAALLSSLGVERITLSEEISKENINLLVKEYFKQYNTYPNLELIVYGRSKLMHTKYCPLKRLGMCGQCKKRKFALKDEYATFPLKFNDDCTVNLLNSKILNLIDQVNYLKGVNYFRLSFNEESLEEIQEIITNLKERLSKDKYIEIFDKNKNTRGHFNNNPL